MPRVHTIHTNFTAGELSESLDGRVDIERYQNGAAKVRNAVVVVQGGAQRRAGSRFINRTKFTERLSILVPFVFSRTQAYVLEFGDFYMRVYRNGAQVPYELATPFSVSVLREITFAQRADTMFIAHQSMPIQRLRRFDHNFWSIEAAPFDPVPFDEVGYRPNTSLTLSSTAIGAGVTLTAGAAVFLASDVGRQIWAGPGVATVTGVTDSTHATATISIPFAAAIVNALGWQLRDSPNTTCTPSADGPIGTTITLTLAADGWRADNIGMYVHINGGLVKITGYTDPQSAQGNIEKALSATVASPPTAWSLESSVWNAFDGYPRAVGLHQQALYAGGTTTSPQTFWRSKIGEVLNFTMGVEDSDAFDYTLDSNEENTILHIHLLKKLMMLTNGGAFSVYGGVEKAIAPTNIQTDNDSDNGCSQVRPVRVGKQLMFVHQSTKDLHALNYAYSSDDFDDEELSILSSHLTKVGIVDMAFQQKPGKLLYLVLGDGTMATVTIDKSQNIVGWALQNTDGHYEAVASIPTDGGNEVWCTVARTINGSVVRYVELFDPAINTDGAVTGTSSGGATVWAGLSHLEGKTVYIKADGANMTPKVVTGGQITIERPAFAIEIGLPYTHLIVTLPPEFQGGAGSVQGTNQRASKVIVRVLDTVGCEINGQYTDFRKFGPQLLDQPPPLFTGDFRLETLGWDFASKISFSSDLPFNFHLLAYITEFTTNS